MTDETGNKTGFSLEELTRLVAGEVAKRLSSKGGVDLQRESARDSGFSVLWIFGYSAPHLDRLELLWMRIHAMGYLQRFILCEEVSQALKERLSFVSPEDLIVLQGGDCTETGRAVSKSLKWCSANSLVYVASLKTASAKKITELDDSDVFSMMLIEALLASTPVHVFRGEELGGLHRSDSTETAFFRSSGDSGGLGRSRGSPSAPGFLSRRLNSLWRNLEQAGVKAIDPKDGLNPVTFFQSAETPLMKSLGGLVTEKDVEEAAKAGLSLLTLASGTVVTPLAVDRAKELNIRLSR